MEQDEGAVHHAPHLLGIGNEVGRDVAAVELHAFYHLDCGFGAFGFVDGDYTFFFTFPWLRQ